MLVINDHSEFVECEPPRMMRLNGDYIERVHEREDARRANGEMPTCLECGCFFEPRGKQ